MWFFSFCPKQDEDVLVEQPAPRIERRVPLDPRLYFQVRRNQSERQLRELRQRPSPQIPVRSITFRRSASDQSLDSNSSSARSSFSSVVLDVIAEEESVWGDASETRS
jgi:hypothetical protein